MSSSESVHSEKMDTRYSTPAPELDDHRPSLGHTAEQPATLAAVPALEVQPATPSHTPHPSAATTTPQLLTVNEAFRNTDVSPSPVVTARDFEQAIDDGSEDEFDNPPGTGRRTSAKKRRFTNRLGRTRNAHGHDRSRDSSASKSSSSSEANSLEAFAEPRRRQRANTVGSARSSIDLQRPRAYSGGTAQHGVRRGTLSSISIPGNITQRTDRDEAEEDVTFPTDEEPGKTYKIDYEELEEFVALCKQGKITQHYPGRSVSGSSHGSPKIFEAHPNKAKEEVQNIALNGESFFHTALARFRSNDSSSSSTADTQDAEKIRPSTDWSNYERFNFFSTEEHEGIRSTDLGGLLSPETSFRDLFDLGPEGGVWWLDILNPTKDEVEAIGKAFKVHRLTREDIEMQEAREKVELFSQYYFVCFRSFNMNKGSEDFLDPIHVYIVVCGDGVLSFSYTRNPHANNVRRRIAKLGDFVSLGPDYICYAMIDDIVDSFAPIIRNAEHESEQIEDAVFIAREDDLSALLRQIGNCRKLVLNMMRLLGGKADVIKGFAKRCNEQYEMTPRGDIGLYLGDIQDHVVTMMSNLGHVEKMLSRSHANYLAQLNVDNILKGNSTNKALAKITVVATILVPLNLVTGLFGMNVAVPGKDVGNLHWFFGIIGCIAAFVIVGLCVARRLRAI